MSTIQLITEDFPSLPIQKKETKVLRERSFSAGSSMSSSSVGAFRDQKTKQVERIPKGTYKVVDDLIVRPHLHCRCEYCGAEWLTEGEWAKGKCQKATKVPVGSCSTVQVLNSKIIHNRIGFKHYTFSVARIQCKAVFKNKKTGQTKTKQVKGWCFSKCLGYGMTHKKSIRSESTTRSDDDIREEVDRSRSNSVASSFIPTHGFVLGEPVLTKVGDNWVKAVVREVHPFMVAVEDGANQLKPHISTVKKMPTRNFVLTRDVDVRNTQLDDKWAVKTGVLKKGQTIAAYTSGFDGYVASVGGWITMRTEHSLNVVNETFVPAKQAPTLFVTNLPEDLTEQELREKLWREFQVSPTSIQFQSNGTAVRAVLTCVVHSEALELAERKTFQIRFGWNLLFSWDLQYLQNKAYSS